MASWAGPYIGLSAGWLSPEPLTTTAMTSTPTVYRRRFRRHAGKNGNFVYGVEGDVNYNGMDGANAGVRSGRVSTDRCAVASAIP